MKINLNEEILRIKSLMEQRTGEDNAKIANTKQKCGLSGSDNTSSRESRQSDRESARIEKAEAKQNAADLKKTFDMSYDRDLYPLEKDARKKVYSDFKQFKQLVDDGQGKYTPEQKFAVVAKVKDSVTNVPSLSYGRRLSAKFNNPNIKSATIQDIIGYAKQMGWDNFVAWFLAGGPEIK